MEKVNDSAASSAAIAPTIPASTQDLEAMGRFPGEKLGPRTGPAIGESFPSAQEFWGAPASEVPILSDSEGIPAEQPHPAANGAALEAPAGEGDGPATDPSGEGGAIVLAPAAEGATAAEGPPRASPPTTPTS